MNNDRPYALTGSSQSDQAQTSTANPGAATIQMRILVELQVISYLLAQQTTTSEDLRMLRQNFADSID